jgi:DNA-binding XRE family transcriptional regulator
MGKTYDEIMAARRARSAPEAKVWAESFAESYDIAAKVMALRLERGLTQADLAARAGIDQADISRIERGTTSPTWRTLQRVLAALDARIEIVSNT